MYCSAFSAGNGDKRLSALKLGNRDRRLLWWLARVRIPPDYLKGSLLVFCAALVPRLLLFFILSPDPDMFLISDSYGYYYLGAHLAQHGAFSPPIGYTYEYTSKEDDAGWTNITGSYLSPENARTPGYPLFLALFFWHGCSIHAIIIAQCLLSSFSCVLLYLLARTRLAPKWALLAGLMLGYVPAHILECNKIGTETLYVFLGIILMLIWERYFRNFRMRDSLLAGEWLGLMTLVRPIAAFWIICHGCLILLLAKLPLRRRVLHIGVGVFGFAALLAPWLMYNVYRGVGLRLCTISAINLYLHNQVCLFTDNYDDAMELASTLYQFADLEFRCNPHKYRTLSEQSDYLTASARHTIITHFPRYVWLHLFPGGLAGSFSKHIAFTQYLYKGGPYRAARVFREKGIWAGVVYYVSNFSCATMWPLIFIQIIPLLVQLGMYLLLMAGLVTMLVRRAWAVLLLGLCFCYYYMFLSGPYACWRLILPGIPALILFNVWTCAIWFDGFKPIHQNREEPGLCDQSG